MSQNCIEKLTVFFRFFFNHTFIFGDTREIIKLMKNQQKISDFRSKFTLRKYLKLLKIPQNSSKLLDLPRPPGS